MRKVDPRHDILRAEGDLFGLGEEIVDTAIEHEATDTPNGDLFLRNKLGGIEHIKGKLCQRTPRQRAASPVPIQDSRPSGLHSTDRDDGSPDRRR